MPHRVRSSTTTATWLALALLGAAACDGPKEPTPTTVEAAPAPLPATRVRVATAARGQLSEGATASGKLHPFKSATIAAEAPGRILTREVERGDAVKRKSLLFRIDTARSKIQYDQAVANEEAARIDLGLAERELGRGEKLIEAQDISRSRFDQLAHSRDSAAKRSDLATINRRLAARGLSDARIRAPFAATAVTVHAERGDYVAPGTPLVTLADLTRLRLRVGLTAAEAQALERAGREPIGVRFDELGGASVQAVLHNVSPLADPRTGTYAAEFWLDQTAEGSLREGMVGRIDLSTLDAAPAILVPRQSVVRHAGGFAVWVVADGPDGPVARRRPVRLGRHDATHTEVREGIAADERVVVDGIFALADGEAVELDGVEG